jgi:hypothetical protein
MARTCVYLERKVARILADADNGSLGEGQAREAVVHHRIPHHVQVVAVADLHVLIRIVLRSAPMGCCKMRTCVKMLSLKL